MFGIHIPFDSSTKYPLFNSIFNASQYMTACQLFMGSPYSFQRCQITDDDIKQTQKCDMCVFTHFPYVANLAGSKNSLAWNGDEKQDRITSSLLSNLEYEIQTIGNIENSGVVIHAGNYPDIEKGLNAIIISINKMDFGRGKLLLENTAGSGTSLCGTLQQIQTIISNCRDKNLGVCIDTCHLFSFGEYDISKKEIMKKFFNDFDKIIGLKYLSLIHLNDSKTEFGKKVDRHENIGQGFIWKDDLLDENSSLMYLIEFCKERNIPMILETSMDDLPVLKALMENPTILFQN